MKIPRGNQSPTESGSQQILLGSFLSTDPNQQFMHNGSHLTTSHFSKSPHKRSSFVQNADGSVYLR